MSNVSTENTEKGRESFQFDLESLLPRQSAGFVDSSTPAFKPNRNGGRTRT
jgi:hypothetical protein